MGSWIIVACTIITTGCVVIQTVNTFHIRRSAKIVADSVRHPDRNEHLADEAKEADQALWESR